MNALRRRSHSFILGAALLSAAACSDSTTAPTSDGALTSAEVDDLALQMGVLVGDGFSASARSSIGRVGGSGVGARAVPAPFEIEIRLDVPCPRGGSTEVAATLSGTIDEATESMVADFTGTQRPKRCGYAVHGKTIRVTGVLRASAHAEIKNGVPVGEHRASLKGDFDWVASDGRRGSCSVDFAATADYAANAARVEGSFCGSRISIAGPLTS